MTTAKDILNWIIEKPTQVNPNFSTAVSLLKLEKENLQLRETIKDFLLEETHQKVLMKDITQQYFLWRKESRNLRLKIKEVEKKYNKDSKYYIDRILKLRSNLKKLVKKKLKRK